MRLRPPAFCRTTELANGQTGYQRLWECPSDRRVRDGIRAWAVLEVAWSPHLRTMVPTLRRLFTRQVGERREVETVAVVCHSLSLPAAGPDDVDARGRVAKLVENRLPALLDGGEVTALSIGAAQIFLAADVIDPEV